MKSSYFALVPVALLLLIGAIILIYVIRDKDQSDISTTSSSEINKLVFIL